MAQLTVQPRGLRTLTDCLLTQAEQGDAFALASVTRRSGGGLVVSGAESPTHGFRLRAPTSPAIKTHLDATASLAVRRH